MISRYLYYTLTDDIDTPFTGDELHTWVEKCLKDEKKRVNYMGCTGDIDSVLIACIIYRESRFRHDIQSIAGATGLMQVMPLHLRNLEKLDIVDKVDKSELKDWQKNIKAGIYILMSYAKSTDDLSLALMAYNAGPYNIAGGVRYAKMILDDYEDVLYQVNAEWIKLMMNN